MLIYPAIDLKDGVCVRLTHGRFDQVTQYDTDPVARLEAFADQGAEWTHVVDLDGAREGRPVQHAALSRLAAAGRAAIQCGGGVRSEDDVARLLDAGAARVVVGSLAVTGAPAVAGWLERFGPERLTLAFDVRVEDGVPVPALKGWVDRAGVDLWTALDAYPPGRLRHVLLTDVGRDGALTGPNLDLLAQVRRRRPDLKLQASGGIATLDDLTAARDLGCDGAIVGRALYEGRFALADAIEAAR